MPLLFWCVKTDPIPPIMCYFVKDLICLVVGTHINQSVIEANNVWPHRQDPPMQIPNSRHQ
jgi:hypothetical protein